MDENELKSGLMTVRGLLDPIAAPWAVAAGSAVYLYTRNRHPADLDVMVLPQDLARVADALHTTASAVATAFGEAQKIEVDGIEVAGALTLRLGGYGFRYAMDEEMVRRIRRVDFCGLRAPVLAPEDIIAFKAVLQRGPEQGKHDLEDIDALVLETKVDSAYLRRRLETMGALERANSVLSTFGLAS